MENEALTTATKFLDVAIRELRETMDKTQEMHNGLFVRMLHVHNELHSILVKLKDVELHDASQNKT